MAPEKTVKAPGQPGGRTVVQYTSVNIAAEPPKDHIMWSIASFVWANFFCLGFVALIFSVKARDRKVVGDLEGARHYGFTARCLNICATVILCIIVVFFILVLAGVVHINNAYYYIPYHNSYPKIKWGN